MNASVHLRVCGLFYGPGVACFLFQLPAALSGAAVVHEVPRLIVSSADL